MAKGRPVGWNIFGDLDPGAWTQLAELDARGRLSLPASVRGRLAWFEGLQSGLLAVVEPGRVELSSWEDFGPQAVSAVAERVSHVPPQAKGLLAIAAMDRYMRLSIEQPGRVVLPLDVRHHLDCIHTPIVRIVVVDGTLSLWSEVRWCEERVDRLVTLTG